MKDQFEIMRECPVGFTCGEIDEVLEIITKIEREHYDEVSDCADAVYGLDSVLEKIRSDNEQLRSWGEELLKEVIDLNEQIKELESYDD